jgi:flagellar motor component MotA
MKREEFEKAYLAIAKEAIELSYFAKYNGILPLEDRIDEEKYEQRDIFHFGMRVVVDGTDQTFLDKILTNIVNQEKDEDEKTLKIVQKEAVLGIQDGDNPRVFAAKLGSYVDNELAKATRKFCE